MGYDPQPYLVGGKPLKHLNLRVFMPGNKASKTYRLRAPNGKAFTEATASGVIEHFAAELERLNPAEEYSVKSVGRGCINFVWMGKKAAAQEEGHDGPCGGGQ